MRLAKLSVPALVTAAMVAVAASAHADPDADFADQLHGYGIYGPLDHNAWLGKATNSSPPQSAPTAPTRFRFSPGRPDVTNDVMASPRRQTGPLLRKQEIPMDTPAPRWSFLLSARGSRTYAIGGLGRGRS